MRARALATSAGIGAALLVSACGADDTSNPRERADRPATPPRGWLTVRNRRAGVSLSVPAPWRVSRAGAQTTIRSPDRLTVVSVAADRGDQGRDALPGEYASSVLAALPGFQGDGSSPTGRVPGSPYRSALLPAEGTLRTSPRPQRIAIAAFTRPRRVTYTIVSFRNARVASPGTSRVLRRLRASLRGQPPS